MFFGVKMILEGIRNKDKYLSVFSLTVSSVQEEYDEAEESIKQHDRSRSFF